jgi:eukaryotic-like serine/threonine-protein kinase
MSAITIGSYTIRRELGRGAMGVVYEAWDGRRRQEVALKVSHTRSEKPEERDRHYARFLEEAACLAALDHPHIVRFFDRGEASGRPFFAMELVRGTTLKARIEYQGPLSVPDLVALSLEVCDALDHMHRQGVVHRDVKPENLMLVAGGGAKLMDFGVACRMQHGQRAVSRGLHGSPVYMSPEQVAGRAVDGRSDIYSLGATLFEAATGRRLVTGKELPAITRQICHEPPPLAAGLPYHLQKILHRALAKAPEHRYQHAGQMAEDIRHGRLPGGAAAGPPASRGVRRPPPVLLGDPENLAAPPAAGPPAPPRPTGAGTPCAAHPGVAGVVFCARCARPLCHACLVRLPGDVSLCLNCARRLRVAGGR